MVSWSLQVEQVEQVRRPKVQVWMSTAQQMYGRALCLLIL